MRVAALALLLAFASPWSSSVVAASAVAASSTGAEVGLGSYRAVLIGVQDYQDDDIPDLSTPDRDVTRLGEVLHDRYGFQVTTLTGERASRQCILDTMSRLRGTLGAPERGDPCPAVTPVSGDDAVIVYFAGHGSYDEAEGEEYWAPVDADASRKSTWVPSAAIGRKLKALPARHALLVVDSCFSGMVLRDFDPSQATPTPQGSAEARSLAADRSRWVITSGGDEPVADQYRDGMSVFAYFFVKQLESATSRYVIADAFFPKLRQAVKNNANQKPHQGPLPGTGHEDGMMVLLNGQTAAPGADGIDVLALARQAESRQQEQERVALVLRQEEERKARAAQIRTTADEEWAAVKRVTRMKNASSKAVLDAWWSKWGNGGRRVEGEWVGVDHVDEARALLDGWDTGDTGGDSGNPAGIDWVRIPGKGYQVARSEVTVRQYALCVDAGVCTTEGLTNCNWGKSGCDEHPMNCVDWHQAVTFAEWAGGRLPSKVEWGYAAHGGESYEYAGSDDVDAVAWYKDNSGGHTHKICTKKRNGYGLCDMSGNVWEWTADEYQGGPTRVFCGGSWHNFAGFVRVSNRSRDDPGYRDRYLGFRLSRSIR